MQFTVPAGGGQPAKHVVIPDHGDPRPAHAYLLWLARTKWGADGMFNRPTEMRFQALLWAALGMVDHQFIADNMQGSYGDAIVFLMEMAGL